MGFGLKKVTNFLLGVDEDYDEEYDDYEFEDEDEDNIVDRSKPGVENISKRKIYSTNTSNARGSARNVSTNTYASNVRSINPNVSVDEYSSSSNPYNRQANTRVNFSYPVDIESARTVIHKLQDGVLSIVSLEGADGVFAQRIADFLSGAVDALDGSMERISSEMFVIVPDGVELTGEFANKAKNVTKSSGGINLSWLGDF